MQYNTKVNIFACLANGFPDQNKWYPKIQFPMQSYRPGLICLSQIGAPLCKGILLAAW